MDIEEKCSKFKKNLRDIQHARDRAEKNPDIDFLDFEDDPNANETCRLKKALNFVLSFKSLRDLDHLVELHPELCHDYFSQEAADGWRPYYTCNENRDVPQTELLHSLQYYYEDVKVCSDYHEIHCSFNRIPDVFSSWSRKEGYSYWIPKLYVPDRHILIESILKFAIFNFLIHYILLNRNQFAAQTQYGIGSEIDHLGKLKFNEIGIEKRNGTPIETICEYILSYAVGVIRQFVTETSEGEYDDDPGNEIFYRRLRAGLVRQTQLDLLNCALETCMRDVQEYLEIEFNRLWKTKEGDEWPRVDKMHLDSGGPKTSCPAIRDRYESRRRLISFLARNRIESVEARIWRHLQE